MAGVRAGKLTGIGLLLLQLLPGTESFSTSAAFCSAGAKQRTATFALRGRDPCAATSRHRNGLLGMAACAMKAPAGKIKGVVWEIAIFGRSNTFSKRASHGNDWVLGPGAQGTQ